LTLPAFHRFFDVMEIPHARPSSETHETKVVRTRVIYACPRHNTALAETHVGKLRVWHCATCSGMWLPAGAFHANVGHVSVIGRGRPAGLLCPRDAQPLTAVIHRGVEVDVCGTCGGIWFDNGELQKILAQSAAPARRFLDGDAGSTTLGEVATSAVDMLGSADFAGEVVSAVFEFLAGLAP